MIGKEVSIKIPGPRRRRRGYIAERLGDKYLVSLYPLDGLDGSKFEDRTMKLKDLRILKTAPAGWRAIDLERPDGKLWVSIRVKPEVIKGIKNLARDNHWDFSTAFNALIFQGLEKAFKSKPLTV